MSKFNWRIALPPAPGDHPRDLLQEAADSVSPDTGGKFVGQLVPHVRENRAETDYCLYIVAPEIGKYSWRLLEAAVLDEVNPYAYGVRLRYHAKNIDNSWDKTCYSSADFESALVHAVELSETQQLLAHLDVLSAMHNKISDRRGNDG